MIRRYFWLTLGFISFGIGILGAILPLLPAFPFFLSTLICFFKSSERLHTWFEQTKWNQKYVVPFVKKKEMTLAVKLKVITAITLLMSVGFFMMRNVPIGQIVLLIVWIGHILYFTFGIRTIARYEAA